MALVLLDRAKETTTVVGTGTATLLGAVTSYQSLAGVGNGNTTYYCIVDQVGANWEVGIGTYTASGTTLARTTVLASSNAGALVVFTTGVKDVFVTYPSEKGVWYDASGNVLFTGTTTAANLAYTGTLTGGTGILNIGSGQVYKDASGNVGIGTSSPRFKLSIGSTTATATATPDTIDLGGTFSNVAGANLKLRLYWNGTDKYGIGVSNAQLDYFAGNAGGSHVFYTTNTERMRIDASGNVGIGTSSPSTKLTVVGSITITGANALRGSYGAGAIATNFAAGDGALASNTTGSNNTASGVNAFYYNTTGANNSAFGRAALQNNTTGSGNSASGQSVLMDNTTGNYNSAFGVQALQNNTTGIQNTASGQTALFSNTTGNYNSAFGRAALYYNTIADNNSAFGVTALFSNTTGANNTAFGQTALYYNTTGSGNSAFNPLNSAGTYAPVFNPTTENNRFCMGSTGVTNAYVQVAWTVVSDARDKTNFAPVPHGLDFVNQLQPTAYQFKENRETDVATGIVRYGFKAQDVLALEGDSPVIIDNEDLDKLRFNESSLIPVLVNAIKELTARLELLEGK